MRSIRHFAVLTVIALFATVLIALSSTTSAIYALTAATYMLPGSLGTPFTDGAKAALTDHYVTGATGTPPPGPLKFAYTPYAVAAPAAIETDSVLFGYSLGAYFAGTYKRDFNRYWADDPAAAPDLTYVLIGNTYRPNGGMTSRWGMGSTPTESVGAGDGEITTHDIVRQYDGAADFPTNPFNVFASANAMAGLYLIHLDYSAGDMDDALYQGSYGDTNYYLIPTKVLPLLMPINAIPGIGPALADSMDPVLRVLIEAGYDRTANPGKRAGFNIFYSPNPVELAENLLLAGRVGSDNWSEAMGLGRPLGTERPGPYGVGGPTALDADTGDRTFRALAQSHDDDTAESSAPADEDASIEAAGAAGTDEQADEQAEEHSGEQNETAGEQATPSPDAPDGEEQAGELAENAGAEIEQDDAGSAFRRQIDKRPMLRELVRNAGIFGGTRAERLTPTDIDPAQESKDSADSEQAEKSEKSEKSEDSSTAQPDKDDAASGDSDDQ